eukprot:5610127-Amphidinium_carterae.1
METSLCSVADSWLFWSCEVGLLQFSWAEALSACLRQRMVSLCPFVLLAEHHALVPATHVSRKPRTSHNALLALGTFKICCTLLRSDQWLACWHRLDRDWCARCPILIHTVCNSTERDK